MRGGKRPGAGRKKGSRTKKTSSVADAALAAGIEPIEVLLTWMRDLWDVGDRAAAAAIARDAAPYCHARKAAIAVSGGETPVRLEYVIEIVEAAATEVETNGEAG